MKVLRTIIVAAFAASALHAQDRVLRVTGPDGQPIAYAFVQANGGRALLTDEEGRVSMGAGKKQTMTIEVRRIGFTPFYGKLDFPDTAITMPVMLTAIAQQLGSVKVTADKSRNSLEMNGFYKRWLDAQKGVTSAVFIGPEEIDKRNSSRLTAILSGVNGVNISRTTNGNSVAVSGAGGACPMAIIIDGRKVCPNGGCMTTDVSHGLTDQNVVLLDQVLDVNSVAGIEVYKRGGNMPSDFHVDGECGAIAFWTGSRKH
jgi:TonB-dependent receptor-like protein